MKNMWLSPFAVILILASASFFGRCHAVWTEQGYLMSDDPAATNHFGGALSLSGDGTTIATGMQYFTLNGIYGAGTVHVLVWNDTAWVRQAILTASDPGEENCFGTDVSLNANGDILAIGAWGKDVESINNAGAVYVFTRTG